MLLVPMLESLPTLNASNHLSFLIIPNSGSVYLCRLPDGITWRIQRELGYLFLFQRFCIIAISTEVCVCVRAYV